MIFSSLTSKARRPALSGLHLSLGIRGQGDASLCHRSTTQEFPSLFGALAEFEREIIKERTNAGLQAARARGRFGGRPTIQSRAPKKIALARKLYADGTPMQEISTSLHIGRSTLYRYLQAEKSRGASAQQH